MAAPTRHSQIRQNGDDFSIEERLRLYEAAERVATLGSWAWRSGRDEHVWSDNLCRLFGFQAGQVSPTRQYVLARTHPDDRERLGRYLKGAHRNHRATRVAFRIMCPGGGIRYMRSTLVLSGALFRHAYVTVIRHEGDRDERTKEGRGSVHGRERWPEAVRTAASNGG